MTMLCAAQLKAECSLVDKNRKEHPSSICCRQLSRIFFWYFEWMRSNHTFLYCWPVVQEVFALLCAFHSASLPLTGSWRGYMHLLREQWKQFQNIFQAHWRLLTLTWRESALFLLLWWGQFLMLVFLAYLMFTCKVTETEWSPPLRGACADINSELRI